MKNVSVLVLAALSPALTLAHYHFPHLILNDKVTNPHEYVREHDNGYMPSWDDGRFLNSNDLRCNKGSENHRTQPKTAKVVAGKDVVGFATNVQAEIRHPGPLQVRFSLTEPVHDGDGMLADCLGKTNRSTSPKPPATSATTTAPATGSRCTSWATGTARRRTRRGCRGARSSSSSSCRPRSRRAST